MRLSIEWGRQFRLKDAARQNMIYSLDLAKVTDDAGVYIFGRRRRDGRLEALYVGKAGNIRSRVKAQLNNLRLMQHLRNARNGRRILLAGRIVTRPGQRLKKCLDLIERAFIRYFLSEGHDLVNKQGTRIRRHKVQSVRRHPKKCFPRILYVERPKGE